MKFGPQMSRDPSPQQLAIRRFLARSIDYFLFGAVFEMIFAGSSLLNAYWPYLVELALWIPVEAGFLARFAWTPGKWLLRLRVAHADGTPPDFKAAFRRSWMVWLWGNAAGLPLLNIVAMATAYRHLTETGRTGWDEKINTNVVSIAG